jgi:hydroxymethylbilane synthase
MLGAAPEREDYRDVLVSSNGCTLETLPPGSVIATGSARRRAQILGVRPDLTFEDIRGNIETRLTKLEHNEIDAVVLAAAGLHRLGLSSRITGYLDPETVLPAPCQGALGVECRANDSEILSILAAIDNHDVRICVDTERTFIAVLGMGCHMPVAALGRIADDEVVFSGFVFSAEKNKTFRDTIRTTRDHARSEARLMAEQFRRALTENK